MQIDIFVTKFKPIAAPLEKPFLQVPQRPRFASDPVPFEDLQPPLPSFARGGISSHLFESSESLDSQDSYQSDVDLTYYTGESEGPIPPDDVGLAHESHILELTNFDGDNDTALPGENNLSRKVKKEGNHRRAQSRRVGTALAAKKELEERTVWLTNPGGLGGIVNRPPATPAISRQSMDRPVPFPIYASSDNKWPEISVDTTYVSPQSPTRSRRQSIYPESTFSCGGHTPVDRKVAASSLYSTTTWGSSRALLSSSAPDGSLDLIELDISEEEAQDINVVAEYARPGKPKLDRILADEVEQSKGSVVVACKIYFHLLLYIANLFYPGCGPTSLNAMVRKIIAAQIDPARIWRGDMRGSITLVSEEFEY